MDARAETEPRNHFQSIIDQHLADLAPTPEPTPEPAPTPWQALDEPTTLRDGTRGPSLMERIDQRAFGLTIKWSDRAPDIDQDEYRQELTIRILENATKDPAHLAQSYGMILQRATWQLGDYVLRKREYRRANFAASFDLDEPATSEPDGPTMAETMITDGMALFRQWHTRADLVLALEDIPHRARQATILAKIAGYRIKDLAPMLDVGPATVSRDIRDATRTLRNDPRLADYNQTPTHKRLITVADLCADTPAGQWSDLQLDTWTIYNGRRIRRARAMAPGELYAAEIFSATPPAWRAEWTEQIDRPALHHNTHQVLINLAPGTILDQVPAQELYRHAETIGHDAAAVYHERLITIEPQPPTTIPPLAPYDSAGCARAMARNARAGKRPTMQAIMDACAGCARQCITGQAGNAHAPACTAQLDDLGRTFDPYHDAGNAATDGPYPATELPAGYYNWPADLDEPIPTE